MATPIYTTGPRRTHCALCGETRIAAGMLRAHLATEGHATRWTAATYRAHWLDTYGRDYPLPDPLPSYVEVPDHG